MQALKSLIVPFISVFTAASMCGQSLDVTFSGSRFEPIELTAPAASGISRIFVLHDLDGVSVSVNNPSARWERFSSMGTAYAREVQSASSAGSSTLTSPEGNAGYVITTPQTTETIWIVDHSAYPLWLSELRFDVRESDCSTAWIEVEGQGERIPYFSVTGAPQWLDRDFQLTYSSLQFDEEEFAYTQVLRQETVAGIVNEMVHCPAPLCQTGFTLKGDRFMRQWGLELSAESPVVEPSAVEAHTRAVQTPRDADNEMKVESALGGSGPVEVTFDAAVTDAAVYHEWEMAHDPEFVQSFWRSRELAFTHTFSENGTVYVRLLCANDAGGCEFSGDTYEVFVGESDLKCPNAFSPGTSPGVNDVWKVSYKSIIEFECHIFDRNGRLLARLDSPSQGWDGKDGGRTVGSGVYFYVIRAKGADGKEYKLSGDINVVGHKRNESTNQTTQPQ